MAELQGADVLYRRWDARPSPGAPRAVFLLVHGLGAHSARWEFLAEHLSSQGITSYAIELRGFGRTPERPRGHVRSFRVWDRDILALADIIGRDFPDRKVFLLGESMGGLIVFNLAARDPERFAGQVLIAPAFKNGMKFPLTAYIKLVLFLLVKPSLRVKVPFTSEMVTRDPDYLRVMDGHPDEIREASLRLLSSFLPEQARASRVAPEVRTPTLLLVPGVDLLVDEREGRRVFDRLGAADKTLVEYPGMLHALSIDLGRDKVFQDIVDWAEARL